MRAAIITGLLLVASLAAWPQKTNHPAARANIEKLQQLSPEQRKSALQRLPPQRQQQIEQRLNRLDQMDPARRERLLERYRRFQSLPPETQNQIRDVGRRLRELPEDRQQVVRGAINRLQKLSAEDRERRLDLPRFKKRFSPAELDIVRRGSGLWHDALDAR